MLLFTESIIPTINDSNIQRHEFLLIEGSTIVSHIRENESHNIMENVHAMKRQHRNKL